MDRFLRKTLLLCYAIGLVLVILPGLSFADYYAMLKVETHPVAGGTDVTKGVQFEIKVVACNEFGNQITPATLGWDYAQFAHIFLQSSDPNAQIKNNLGQWVSMTNPPYDTRVGPGGDRIFEVILNTVGDDKRTTAQQNPAYWTGIIDGYLDFKVHDFVDHFDISIPPGAQMAGVAFNITIYAKDVNNNIAETFNDNVDIWAVIPPDYTYEPNMTPSTIAGSSFTDGVATTPVTIYGSHPVSRLVKVKCESTVMHGGKYAKGESDDFAVNPNSYAKILLLVPGEEHRPGRLIGSGKQGSPATQTTGAAFNVTVYTTDEYWNPIFASVPITFTSSDLAADLPASPTMTTNPETFPVTFHTVGLGTQWIRITEGAKESASTDIPVEPNDIFYFEFDSNIASPQQTTQPFQIDVTAYDADGNVATDYNQEAQLSCTMGAEYANPDTIKFTNGRGNVGVRVTKMGLVKIIVDDGTHFVRSNEFLVLAGDFNKLLVLLDGETHTPGLGDGKAGTPNSINAGDSTTVTIIACDDYWNPKAIPVEISDISSLTGHIQPPLLPFTLGAAGSGQCQVTFRTAYDVAMGANEPQTITVSGGGRTATSSPITVRPGPYDKLVLVAPGESLDPGTEATNGKSGFPTTQVAGTSFTLTVAATDAYWNPVESGYPNTIYFNSGDTSPEVKFAGLPQESAVSMRARIKDFAATLITLASPQLVTVTDGNKNDQVNIRLNHALLDHFAFSTIADYTAGDTIHNVTIAAKDRYNNTVLSFNQTATLSSTTGANTFIPTTAAFTNGQSTVNVIIYKATYPNTLKLSCSYTGRSGESNPFVVSPGPYAKLILLLPGENHEPGNIVTEGKSGTPWPYIVANPDRPTIETTVYAVDEYWNKVNPLSQPVIHIDVENPTKHFLNVEPGNPLGMIGGKITFQTTLRTAATGQTLIATDMGNPDIFDTSKIDVYPGLVKKLQIIAPGQTPVPGSDLGKIGAIQNQVTGVNFDLIVRAVDQYWNLVPGINLDRIELNSKKDPTLAGRCNPGVLVDGVTSFTIWLDEQNKDIDITAVDLDRPLIEKDLVWIHVTTGYQYVVEVPAFCIAGTLATNKFSMTVKLVDKNQQVVTDANNWFQMTPRLAENYSPATNPDGLGVKEKQLIDGKVTFDQSYDIVERISIRVNDNFGREKYSDGIDVRESGLKYKVDVPNEATAGKAFGMTVSLIDTGTDNVVPIKEKREVQLVPNSAQPGREGSLDVTSVTLYKGTGKITNQRYTKAEIVSIKASDREVYDRPAQPNSSPLFRVLPGELKKLQIVAPGEQPRPGEIAYIASGKDSTGILEQRLEIAFLVEVRAVDQYWNVVDFNGGPAYLSSECSFSSDQEERAFSGGMATFIVTLHQAREFFTITVEAKNPNGLQRQSVSIPMQAAKYLITTPVVAAETATPFTLNIKLVDPETGERLAGANNEFILTACTVNCEPAPGKWIKMGGSLWLVNGEQEISVVYDTVGTIRFKVSDSFGHEPAYTGLIDIKPVGLRYDVEAPETVEAGKEFPLTVRLIDTGAGNLVTPKEYARHVELVACSSPDGNPAEGRLKVKNFYLKEGEETVLESYNLAHVIYIEASDAKQYDPQSTQGRTSDIEVIGTPETVMKLHGVCNEINGALYLRTSTTINIMSISDIIAEEIVYRDNGSDWKTYAEPFNLSQGVHIIEHYGIDKHGHKEKTNRSKTMYVSFIDPGVDGVFNRPNPFKAGKEPTLIEYNLKEPSNVTITIYDLFGQEVWRENYRQEENGGAKENSVPWYGGNLSGKVVANGGYICRIWIEREKRHMLRKIAVAK